MSVRARYCSSRRRRPTSSSRPRRLWWSCLWTLRCSVRSLIRRVSSATWTSGEPVSPSLVACSAMSSFFTAVSSGTWHSYRCVWSRVGADGERSCPWPPASRLRVQLTWPATPTTHHGITGGPRIRYRRVPPDGTALLAQRGVASRNSRRGPATAPPRPLAGLAHRDRPRLVHVAPHLLGQFRRGAEPLHAPQPGNEVDPDV